MKSIQIHPYCSLLRPIRPCLGDLDVDAGGALVRGADQHPAEGQREVVAVGETVGRRQHVPRVQQRPRTLAVTQVWVGCRAANDPSVLTIIPY